MLDKLQVSGAVKNYLISIDNELEVNYRQMVACADENFDNAVEEFVGSVAALLDYYAEPIHKSGRMVIAKKTGIHEEIEDVHSVEDFKSKGLEKFTANLKDAIFNCFDNREDDDALYSEIITVVVAHCINFFKKAQLETCAKFGIDEVTLLSSKESCSLCRTKSQFKHKVKDLLAAEFHPFCKLSLEIDNGIMSELSIPKSDIKFVDIPTSLTSRAKNTVEFLKIYVPEYITDRTFVFTDDIMDKDLYRRIVAKYGEEKAEGLRNIIGEKITFYEIGEYVYVSSNCTNIEYVIASNLLRKKIIEIDRYWWRDEFAKRCQSKWFADGCAIYTDLFVNYAAEQNWESYFLESAVFYILEPQLLKNIDSENYNQLKTLVFKDKEFLRG